ncbi:MAG: hypothetical protein WD066_14835 [Planctomycetaceae bacterium]
MSATLTIRDENLAGQSLREWELEVLTERLTVRELLHSRVYQEVQDYNRGLGDVFQGLVQPEEAEKALNGWKLKQPRQLDWKKQHERAVEAFEQNRILILVNDRQAASLDEEFEIEPQTNPVAGTRAFDFAAPARYQCELQFVGGQRPATKSRDRDSGFR